VGVENIADEGIRYALAKIGLDSDGHYGSGLRRIVGNSAALRRVLSIVGFVAPTDATVLINGETGTGKELIARAVHKQSRRAGRAFVSVNCAALAPSLISSELRCHPSIHS
jgi:transcriptional regulator with GAF, ATPase, and Fis domain